MLLVSVVVVVVVVVQMLQVHTGVSAHAEETKFPPRVPAVPRNSDGSRESTSKFSSNTLFFIVAVIVNHTRVESFRF